MAGRWAGTISFRGDSTVVRLEIPAGEGPSRVLLDLPELVMHREPAPAAPAADGLEVELPLGIGSIRLSLEENVLRGSRALGGDRITVELRPDPIATPPFREIEIHRGDAVLKGSLVSPAGPGPHPAVVLLHGSAAASRESWAYRSWAWAMARRGVAALAYDRRGSGASTAASSGIPGFDELAGDALAWVEHLRAMPSIRREAVGLMGGSQAGWVAPLAASRSDSVAFLVLRSPPSTTPSRQETLSALGRARARGLGAEALSDLRSYLRLYFFVAVTGRGWELLQEEIRRASAAPWGGFVDQPETADQLAWWKAHADLSPAEVLPRVAAPVLAAYGTRDLIVPPESHAPVLESLLRRGGNQRVRVLILEGADHRLELPMGRDAAGRWRWPRIAPEFLEEVDGWIGQVARTSSLRGPASPVRRPGPIIDPRSTGAARQYFCRRSASAPVRGPSLQSLVRSHHSARPRHGPNRL